MHTLVNKTRTFFIIFLTMFVRNKLKGKPFRRSMVITPFLYFFQKQKRLAGLHPTNLHHNYLSLQAMHQAA